TAEACGRAERVRRPIAWGGRICGSGVGRRHAEKWATTLRAGRTLEGCGIRAGIAGLAGSGGDHCTRERAVAGERVSRNGKERGYVNARTCKNWDRSCAY